MSDFDQRIGTSYKAQKDTLTNRRNRLAPRLGASAPKIKHFTGTPRDSDRIAIDPHFPAAPSAIR
jgi:hypothetical protein